MPQWKRTFWAVWVANAVTAMGMLSFLPFFPGYLEHELGVPEERVALWTGVVFGAAPLLAAFTSPVWGALGDRVGRKLMVLRAMSAIALFVGCMGFAQSPWQLLALRLLQGVFSGFVPPSITLVSVSAPQDRQGSVAGSLQSALAVGAIAGPLLGGAVVRHHGHRAVFGVVAVLAVLSGLLVLVLAREDASHRQGRGRVRPLELLRGSLRDLVELLHHRRLRGAIALLFCVQFGAGATNPLLELFVRELWPGDPAHVATLTGWLFSLFAATTLVAMPLWGRLGDKRGHRPALLGAAAGTSIALGLHALVTSHVFLWPARVLLGGFASGAAPSSFGLAAELTAPERRGGAHGAVFAARALAVSTSAVAGGWLCGWLGLRGLFAVSAGLLALAVLVQLGGRRTPG